MRVRTLTPACVCEIAFTHEDRVSSRKDILVLLNEIACCANYENRHIDNK